MYLLSETDTITKSEKKATMKIVGIILIIIGVLMLVTPSISFTKKEEVVDIGSLEINKREKKTITWPYYTGGLVIVAGVVLLFAGGKKRRKDV